MWLICDKCNFVCHDTDVARIYPCLPCGCKDANPRALTALEEKIYRQGFRAGQEYHELLHNKHLYYLKEGDKEC